MKYKIQKLSEEISQVFKNKSKGHCLRINDLMENECFELCELLSSNNDFKSYVITNSRESDESVPKHYQISLDAAIELRNKKANSICLIFSPGTDVPASLSNTFEVYDIFKFLRALPVNFLLINLNPYRIPMILGMDKRKIDDEKA